MTILRIVILLLILAMSFYMWPKDQRSLRLVVTTAAIMIAVVGVGDILYHMIPVTKNVTVVKTITRKYVNPPKVVYKDRIIYRAPDAEVETVSVKDACEGKVPLQLVKIDEQTEGQSQEDKDAGKTPASTTWILAHPVGSKVLITCAMPGAYDNFWKVDDVVQITRGIPQ